jgi:periplasmic protein TonB
VTSALLDFNVDFNDSANHSYLHYHCAMIMARPIVFRPQRGQNLLRWPLVLGMQLLLLWPFLMAHTSMRMPLSLTPLIVSLISMPTAPAPAPATAPIPVPAPLRPRSEASPTRVVSPVAIAAPAAQLRRPDLQPAITPTPSTTPAELVSVAPSHTMPDLPPPEPPALVVASKPVVPPAPPARRQLAASAVQYRVWPPVEVPRASKRAGESGTVWLRVVVSISGEPVQVSVQRSSGFARLDEQALWAMRQARFQPHSEDGRAVEVDVIAPIEYPAD